MYSLQVNAHGLYIICKGTDVRRSYTIVHVGTYRDCQSYRARQETDAWELDVQDL